jgi:hypothetical protein
LPVTGLLKAGGRGALGYRRGGIESRASTGWPIIVNLLNYVINDFAFIFFPVYHLNVTRVRPRYGYD